MGCVAVLKKVRDVLVVDGVKGPPGPVPIPVAKLVHADGTAPGRGWESRLPPTLQLHYFTCVALGYAPRLSTGTPPQQKGGVKGRSLGPHP